MKKLIIPIALFLGLAYAVLPLVFWDQREASAADERMAELVAPDDTAQVNAPDPSADTLGFLSRVYQLYKGGALVPALILLAWGAAVFASRKWSKLREGRLAVYFAAGLTALAMLAERASSGDTPTLAMILSALASAVVLALRPQPSPPKPPAPIALKAVP